MKLHRCPPAGYRWPELGRKDAEAMARLAERALSDQPDWSTLYDALFAIHAHVTHFVKDTPA